MTDPLLAGLLTFAIVLAPLTLFSFGRTVVAFATAREAEPELGVREFAGDVAYMFISPQFVFFVLIAVMFAGFVTLTVADPIWIAQPIGLQLPR